MTYSIEAILLITCGYALTGAFVDQLGPHDERCCAASFAIVGLIFSLLN